MFTGLSKSTEDLLLAKLGSFNVIEVAEDLERKCLLKWNQHCRREEVTVDHTTSRKTPILPKNFIRYNNILKSKCPRCGPAARNSSSHLKLVHKMNVPSALELVEMLEETVPKGNKKVSRKEMQDMREKIINFYLTKVLNHLKHGT